MLKTTMSNHSRVTEFILHGFSDIEGLQIFHSIIFLVVYLVAVTENLLIITVIIYTPHLHTPMYFFLVNLSVQDMGSISVTVPKSVANSFMNTQDISYSGCVSQVFFLVFFMLSHFYLLGVMAYDRYVAICNPLHYETVMNKKTCIQLATGAWTAGLVYTIFYTGNAFTVDFCSNVIYQFFCEIPQLLKISCSGLNLTMIWVMVCGASLCFFYFGVVIFSYVWIIKAVLRIPSTKGKQKAFSTCLPHLTVITLFLVSGTFAYLKPISSSVSGFDLFISILYCMVPPVMNPLIYSMRNTELKTALRKLILSFVPSFSPKNPFVATLF